MTDLIADYTDTDRWYTLGAFRGCDAHEHEHGINYAATLERYGSDAVAEALAAGDRAGMLTPLAHDAAHCDCYAVLDVRAFDGDILTDRCIPTREAFNWWVGAVELDADMSDCEDETPAAYARTYAWAGAAGADPVSAAAILLAKS